MAAEAWSVESMQRRMMRELGSRGRERRACEVGWERVRTQARRVVWGRWRRAVLRPRPMPRLAPVRR